MSENIQDRTIEAAQAKQTMHRRMNSVFVSGSSASAGHHKSRDFDRIRGISPELNAHNNLNSFMPTHHESARLAVLQNFKEINKMIRSNFMNAGNRKGLDSEEQTRREKEDEATGRLTNAMKQLYQPY